MGERFIQGIVEALFMERDMRRYCMQAVCCLLLCVVSGCYTTPVRHLAADSGLIKEGHSNKGEVLALLGKPDQKKQQADGSVVWIYRQSKKSMAEKLPWLGKKLGAAEQVSVIIRFDNNIVSKIRYSTVDPDDLRWRQQSLQGE